MGQGQSQQSQGGSKSPSNQARPKESAKDRKSKRKSSGKSKERHNNNGSSPQSHSPSLPSTSNSYASRSGDMSNGSTKKSSSTSHNTSSQPQHQNHQQLHHSSSASGPREAPPPSGHHHRHPQESTVTDTSPGAQRGSYHSGGGGERSAPSRQFSLTRQTSSTQNRHSQIEKYFNKYKDPVEDAILAEGMEKFCVDLGVDPTEFIVLVLAWKFEASQMCRFTREEFINGCQKMQAHNSKSLKESFPDILGEAEEKKNFKDLYNFTFSFGLDHSSGQCSLPIDMAMPLWDLVFTQSRPDVLDPWFKFLRDSGVRGISRDTWNMFLPFVESIFPDLSNNDESETWPSLFDDFVEAAEVERTTLLVCNTFVSVLFSCGKGCGWGESVKSTKCVNQQFWSFFFV